MIGMKTFRDASIKWKLTFISMVIVIAVLVLALTFLTVFEFTVFKREMVEELSAQAKIVGLNSSAAILFDDAAEAEELLSSLRVKKNIIRAVIFRPDGSVFASFPYKLQTDEIPKENLNVPEGKFLRGSLVISQPIIMDGKEIGFVYIESGFEALYTKLGIHLAAFLIIILAAIPAAFLLSFRLQKVFSDPVSNLANAAQRVSLQKDYSVRVLKTANDELGTLTDTFNEMLEQIQLRDSKLEKHATNLEEEVIIRTEELSVELAERKEAERKMRIAKEQAEKATKLKDKFISLVSHDLRSPIALIKMLSKRLLKTKHDDGRNKETIGSIDESCRKMMQLLDDILNLVRLQGGEMKIYPEFIEAKFFGLEVMVAFKILAEHKGVTLVNEIPSENIIYADKALFGEVINNLVSNAIKFCSKGDTVSLFIPKEEPSTIAVKDTGTGIEPEYLADLFDYEKKTTSIGTAGEYGTGLGLPLCMEIMRAHGGDLVVDSTVRQGSVFYAKLPFVRPE